MHTDYRQLRFQYRATPDQRTASPARHPVIVVGAGPVGLSVAIDLAQQGVRVVLLDESEISRVFRWPTCRSTRCAWPVTARRHKGRLPA